MSPAKKRKSAPIVTEEMFPVPKREPLNHNGLKLSAMDAISRVALIGRPDVNGEDRRSALVSLDILAWHIDQCRMNVVTDMRNQGETWQQIGDALGVTRSAAQQRFG